MKSFKSFIEKNITSQFVFDVYQVRNCLNKGVNLIIVYPDSFVRQFFFSEIANENITGNDLAIFAGI